MDINFRFTAPEHSCSYLPVESARMEYLVVRQCSSREYGESMISGWRRFGHTLFHPTCPHCNQCRSLRVPAATFLPNRSQQRAIRANADVILKIGVPKVDRARIDLHEKYHEFQSEHVGWNFRGREDVEQYRDSFVNNPFDTLEFTYWLGTRLLGVGYVDDLPVGMSAIYFFYDPEVRDRSLGKFNVLKILEECQRRQKPHVYLGYFVEGCRSLQYKATFGPNESFDPATGSWSPFSRD